MSIALDTSDIATEKSGTYLRYVLWILMLSCALNFLDRQIVNILAEPIKKEFGLSDTQLGLLTGFSFAAFHATLCIPVAILADRTSRVSVLAGSVGIWSIATIASGFTTSFIQLLLGRMAVGAGEAGGIAPAHAIIADYAPKEKRARSIAFYSMGIPIGGLLGMGLGGVVLDLYGWRTAFVIAGLPGLVLAPLIALTIRKPGEQKADRDEKLKRIPTSVALREMFGKRAFVLVTAAGALLMFVSFGQAAFIASFFFRLHGSALGVAASDASSFFGWSLGAAAFLGLTLGLIRGLSGIAGTLLGGQMTDRMNRDGYSAYTTIPALMALLRIPIAVAGFLSGEFWVAFLFLSWQWLLSGIGLIGGFTAVQGLVRPEIRATAAAVYAFGINLIGLGLGPLAIGAFSDVLASSGLGPTEGLRWALVASCGVLGVAAALNWAARRSIVAESVS